MVYRNIILKSRTIKVKSYPYSMFQCLNVNTEVVNPATPFCNKGEEEEEEQDRLTKHAGKELYKPCLDNKECILITGLPWHFYCRCMFYVPHSVLDISML